MNRTAPTPPAPTIINPQIILNLSSNDFTLISQPDGNLLYQVTQFPCRAAACTQRFPSLDLLRRHHNEYHHPGHPSSLYPTTQTEIKERRTEIETQLVKWNQELRDKGKHESQNRGPRRGGKVSGCFVRADMFVEQPEPASLETTVTPVDVKKEERSMIKKYRSRKGRVRGTQMEAESSRWFDQLFPEGDTQQTAIEVTKSTTGEERTVFDHTQQTAIEVTKTTTGEERTVFDLRTPEPEAQQSTIKMGRITMREDKTTINLLSDSSEGLEEATSVKKRTRGALDIPLLQPTATTTTTTRNRSVGSVVDTASSKRCVDEIDTEEAWMAKRVKSD